MDCRVFAIAGLVAAGCSTVEGQDEPDGLVTVGGTRGADDGDGDGGQSVPGTGSDGDADDTRPGGSSDGDPDDGPATSDEADGSDGAPDPPPKGGDPWTPEPGTTWQWQLTGPADTSLDVDAYDIDLFDVEQSAIDELHADGRAVICYFSGGSYEEWREGAKLFPDTALGDPLDEWPGERWLDYRDPAVRDIMSARLDLAVDKHCDAVEPDNVDGYTNPTGFDLVGDDQLDYNRWLAQQAHARALSIGLKNDVDQVPALVDDFDWALNEECVTYEECETNSPFIDQGKAVFHVEYVDDIADGPALAEEVCPQTTALGFSTLIKEWDLTVWRLACP